MRKPLIELHELHEYASKMKRRKWGTKFYNAAQLVTGIAASPLEVAGILLLSLPRSRGGAPAFGNVYVNDLTPLTASAQSLQGKKSLRGYRDRKSNHRKQATWRFRERLSTDQAPCSTTMPKRMTALQSMGYEVLLVTHEMLNDAEQLDAIRAKSLLALGFAL